LQRLKGPSSFVLFVFLEESLSVGLVDLLSDDLPEKGEWFFQLEIADKIDVVDLFGHVAFDASLLLHLYEGLAILIIVEIFVLGVVLDHLVDLGIDSPILLDVILPEESDQVFPLILLDLLLQPLHH
jgi:hypothetical protein